MKSGVERCNSKTSSRTYSYLSTSKIYTVEDPRSASRYGHRLALVLKIFVRCKCLVEMLFPSKHCLFVFCNKQFSAGYIDTEMNFIPFHLIELVRFF